MTNTPILQSEIIEKRKARAAGLAKLSTRAKSLGEALEQVASSSLNFNRPKDLFPLIAQLQSFTERVDRKLRLFENGMVTICIAGMEKSGKSTMLSQLTKIDLPTAQERCTSVSSDILYEDTEEGWFDIAYYTQQELHEVVTCLWDYLHNAPADAWCGSRQDLEGEPPADLDEFLAKRRFPGENDLDSQYALKYESALKQLRTIQTALSLYRSKLGTVETRLPIASLQRYVSHKTKESGDVSPDQCLIRKASIHSKFENGCPALRLCDTPGVDDPNRNARDLTYRTIREEADILVVAHRPDNRPDPTDSMSNFISDLKRTDQDAPLRERTVYFVNWNKLADPTRSAANTHIEKMRDKNIFQEIYGPCNVLEEGAAAAFLRELNSVIATRLPVQDDKLIAKLEQEFKSLQSSVRLNIFDDLSRQMPPLPEAMDMQMQNMYDTWFNKKFFPALVSGMNSLTESCTLPELESVRKEINTILAKTDEEMKAWIQQHAGETQCDQLARQGQDPVKVLLPSLAKQMTDWVSKLTLTVANLCPAIQKQILQAIANAMGEDTAAAIFPGSSARECLAALHAKLRESAESQGSTADEARRLADGLMEFSDMQAEMGYVMRYEMRPCLNLLDHLRWRDIRRPQMINRCKNLLGSSKAAAWLEQAKFPSFADSAAVQARFLRSVTGTSIELLQGVLGAHASQLQMLVDDFLSQASQTLATQDHCRTGWHRGLAFYKRTILAQEAEELLASAEDAEAFRELRDTLEQSLN